MVDSFIKHPDDYDWSQRFNIKGKASIRKVINEGVDGSPEIFISKMHADRVIAPHSHSEDEVI